MTDAGRAMNHDRPQAGCRSHRRRTHAAWRKRLALAVALAAWIGVGCTNRLPLPDEPVSEGTGTGEIAYVVQYRWLDVPRFGDMVLTVGILFVVEDSTHVRAYISDKATPVVNQGFSLPDPVVVGGQTLGKPVQLAAGVNKTLWVAFRQPSNRLVQFKLTSPPTDTGLWVDAWQVQSIGGIAADADSGFVYVSDDKGNQVSKYHPTSAGGNRVALLALEGNGDLTVREPRGLYCFGDSLLVVDSGKSWIQVIDADVAHSGRGQVLGPIDEPLVLHDPVDAWVDASGRYYVAEQGRVLQITPQGQIKEIVTDLDTQAAPLPAAVVANTTQVWVADPLGMRCTIYQINTVSEELP